MKRFICVRGNKLNVKHHTALIGCYSARLPNYCSLMMILVSANDVRVDWDEVRRGSETAEELGGGVGGVMWWSCEEHEKSLLPLSDLDLNINSIHTYTLYPHKVWTFQSGSLHTTDVLQWSVNMQRTQRQSGHAASTRKQRTWKFTSTCNILKLRIPSMQIWFDRLHAVTLDFHLKMFCFSFRF